MGRLRPQAVAVTTAAALATALATGVPAPAAAHARVFTPGAAGAGDPYFPLSGNGGYDVRHYDLDLAYDPSPGTLTATARITARATQDLSRFDLDLTGLTVRSVTVNGARAAFRQEGQELVVTPAAGLPRGRVFTVGVRYDGRPRAVTDPDGSPDGWIPTDDGVFNANEPQGAMTWYPGNHHPTDKATYRFRVTVPAGLVAVANGVLAGRSAANGKVTFTWTEPEPMASYLATVSIGRFQVAEGRTRSGLHSYVAIDPREAGAREVMARNGPIVEFFERHFGPYPFGATGGIVDHADVPYALETQTRPVYPGTPGEITVAHELAHQWFGDSVTPVRWRDIWLNEGFVTYAEWMWAEHIGRRTVQQSFDQRYAIPADDEFWRLPPGDPGDGAHIFADAVYGRGAMTLHVLRKAVGDAAFFRILRAWATGHRHGHGTTAQFIALSERVSGRQLDGLFQQWLYEKGKPRL